MWFKHYSQSLRGGRRETSKGRCLERWIKYLVTKWGGTQGGRGRCVKTKKGTIQSWGGTLSIGKGAEKGGQSRLLLQGEEETDVEESVYG